MTPTLWLKLAKVLAPVALVAGVWGWGYHAGSVKEQRKAALASAEAAKEAAEQREVAAEIARLKERVAAKRTTEIHDELLKTRVAADRRAADAAERLRNLSTAYDTANANAALAACRSADAPAVAVLRDETRNDLVQLAQEADALAARYRACQRYVIEVALPTCGPKETASVQSSN